MEQHVTHRTSGRCCEPRLQIERDDRRRCPGPSLGPVQHRRVRSGARHTSRQHHARQHCCCCQHDDVDPEASHVQQARISEGRAPARIAGHHDHPLPDRYRRQRCPVSHPEIQRRRIARRGDALGTVQMPLQAGRQRWPATARVGSGPIRLVVGPHPDTSNAARGRCAPLTRIPEMPISRRYPAPASAASPARRCLSGPGRAGGSCRRGRTRRLRPCPALR